MNFLDSAHLPPTTGAVDRFVRRFSAFSYGATVLVLYAIAATAIGLALAPGLWILSRWAPPLWDGGRWQDFVALGALFGAAFFVCGFSLLVVVAIYNAVLPTRVRPYRGGYFSAAAIPWYLHNGLFYLARFTFLPFVTLTPFGIAFLRAMRMRMGRRPRITTEHLSDPCLITLGDDVVIGGSAHVFCHYGGAGHLVIAPVEIGSRATIGQEATVMGDVVIGAGATILAHSVLMPGTRVGPGETWGGVPARPIPSEEWGSYQAVIRGQRELPTSPVRAGP